MPDRVASGPELYALVAEFNRPEALKAAVERARKHGFTRVEAFSPFPIEGLAESLGFEERVMAPVMLAGAIAGALIGFFLQVGANLDFPLNIGGRPVISVPAFILITFELMVLGAVCSMILAMLLLNRLPRLHHPLFEIPSFHFATADKFFLAILADDAKFDPTQVRRFLKSLDPVNVEAAGYAETAPMKRLIALAALLLAGCDQMAQQPRYDAFGRAKLFADGQVNQTPPAGTVAQEDATWQAAETTRPAMTPALLARGQARYAIDCVQCHGVAGGGDGVVPARGFPRPESFASPRLRGMTADHVVDVITHGYGIMYSHADRVLPADRWAIAAYVEALQLSQAAPVASLSPDDLKALEAGHAQ